MDQEKLTKIVSENLSAYRKACGYTQSEIAEKVNYSDKSVSKWEMGNGMPDIFVLQSLAEIYGVTVNDFLREHTEDALPMSGKKDPVNRTMIMVMSAGLCWLVAMIAYVFMGIFDLADGYRWLAFIYALPATAIVILVLACVWKYYLVRVISASALVWLVGLAFYLTARDFVTGAYSFFLLCIPVHILLLLWFLFLHRMRKKQNK